MQKYNSFDNPTGFFVSNINVYTGAVETIVLADISVAGFANLSFTLTNKANSSDIISSVSVYGSNDGINYFTITSNALSSIGIGSTVNYRFAAVCVFVKITATSNSTSNLDCYLVGVPGSASTSGGGGGSGTVTSISAGTGLSGGTITTTGTIAVNYGATSTTSTVGNDSRLAPTPTENGKLIYDTGSAYAETGVGTTHQLLHGATGSPTWGAVDLSSEVTGTLPASSVGAYGSAISAPGITSASGVTSTHTSQATSTLTPGTIFNNTATFGGTSIPGYVFQDAGKQFIGYVAASATTGGVIIGGFNGSTLLAAIQIATSDTIAFIDHTTGAGAIVSAGSLSLTTALPISSGGTGLVSTSQNFIFSGPTSGAGAPTWRALVAGDIPSLSGTYLPLTGGTMSGAITVAGINNSLIMTGAQATGTSPNIGLSLGTTSAGANAAPQYSPILEFLAGGFTGSVTQTVGLNLKVEPTQGATIGVLGTVATRTTTAGSYTDSLQFGTDTAGTPRWSSVGTTLNYYTSAGDGMMVSSGQVNLSVGAGSIVRVTSSGLIPFNVGTSFNGTTGNYWSSTVSKTFTCFNAAIATAQTVGISAQNTTAAAAGAQQYSPVLELQGQGWKTTSTAATQTVSFGMQTVPVQGTTNPTGILNFMSNINAGGYSNTASIDNKGRLHIGINGTAQSSSNIALSAAWGSTAAVSAVSGTDSQMKFTVTAGGLSIAADPTITITWADGTWGTTPFSFTKMNVSSDVTLTYQPVISDVPSATNTVITVGAAGGTFTPVTGQTYVFLVRTIGA